MSPYLFNDLLVSPLHRTIPFPETNHISKSISEDLHFDMSGFRDVFLDEYTIITEGFDRFSASRLKSLQKRAFFVNDPHSLSTTA